MKRKELPSMEELKKIRLFLVNRWLEFASERDRTVTHKGEGMCRFTSFFLQKLLGAGWRVAGGGNEFFDIETMTTKPIKRGYFDGKMYHGHYWVTDGKTILDLTASQFGDEEIVIAEVGDPRFCGFKLMGIEYEEAHQDVKKRSNDWVEWWKDESRLVFSESSEGMLF